MKKNGKPAPAGPVRAAIYRRVSSERQGERVSPEVQLSECEAYTKERGYVVAAVYTDIEKYRVRGRMVEPSGTRTDRPGFTALLADASAGRFERIIAWRIDRLFRGVKPAISLDDVIEETGITVELVRETFDRRTLLLMAAIGRMESESIRERTEMGHRERVRRGLIHGGPVPAGYVAVRPTWDNGAAREPAAIGYTLDPAWRAFFDELARLYLSRKPLAEIARELGCDPRTGRPWQSGTLSYLLRNPFYRGQLAYGWQSGSPEFTVPGRHTAAWDAATCAAIERELARRGGRRNGPRGRGLLSGVLRCGICGKAMATGVTTTVSSNGTAHRYRVYGCGRPVLVRDGRWAGRPSHQANYINEARCLRLVRDFLAQTTAAEADDFLAGAAVALGGPAPDDSKRHAGLEAEGDRLRSRLADLTAGLDGVRHASPAATETILAAITTAGRQLDRVRADLGEMETRRRTAPDLGQAREAMLDLMARLELFDAPGEELQTLLRAGLPALYVADGKIVPAVPEWDDDLA